MFGILLDCLLIILYQYFVKTIRNEKKQLQTKVNHLSEKIETKQHYLSQQIKLEVLGNMLDNMTQQFLQPLNVLTTTSTGMKLKQEYGLLHEKDINTNLQIIHHQTKRISNVIENVRLFCEVSQRKELFLIKKVIEHTHNMLKIELDNNCIDFHAKVEPIEILGVKNTYMQIIIYLLQYLIQGLQNSSEGQKHIGIYIYKKEQFLIIKLRNNQGHIDKKVIQTLFTNSSSNRPMYIVKELITKTLKANITAKSNTYHHSNQLFEGLEFTLMINLEVSKEEKNL